MKKYYVFILIIIGLYSCKKEKLQEGSSSISHEEYQSLDNEGVEKQEDTAESEEEEQESQEAQNDRPLPLRDTISIVAVGDIMIGSNYPSARFLPKDDAENSFVEVKDYLKGDIVFGNLEGVLLDNGPSEKCKDKDPNLCYAFRMPERYGQRLKEAGFNLLSVANNHTMDFGDLGKRRTKAVLDELGIYYAGYNDTPFSIFEKEGVKYGFCAFAPNRNMLSINNITKAKQLVQELKTKADIVIVSFHGGAEGVGYRRVPKQPEIYFGENRGNVHHFAHSVIDAGADIVLGHGPHVTRAVEVYKDRFIAYSLGNFNTYGTFSLRGASGIAPLLDIKMDNQGKFLYAKAVSIKQTKKNGLELDQENRAFHELKTLSDMDFPAHHLDFNSERNMISKKNQTLKN